MVIMSVIERFVYPPHSSLILTAITLSEVLVLCGAGFGESIGIHFQYSKFGNNQPKSISDLKVSSRIGMLIFYTPALLSAVIALGLFSDEMNPRFLLVATSLAVHFLKRNLEVVFIHKFSGNAALDHSIVISISYVLITTGTIYAQYLSQGLPEPPVDLMYVGVVVFFIGISGNFYHHYLLSNLRKEGEKQYKVPQGGLFSLVICPHYLFELLGFLGISLISQTIYAFFFTIGMTVYLVGRSHATRKWYLSKFEDFPKDVKALIPYIY